MLTDGKISATDMDLIHVTDDVDEAIKILVEAAGRREKMVDEWGNYVGIGQMDQAPGSAF